MNYSTSTKQQYRYWCRRLMRHAHAPSLKDISFDEMTAFFRSLSHTSQRTAWNAWNAIHAAFHHADIWPSLTPEFRKQFEREFLSLRPLKLPRTFPLADTLFIPPDDCEAWLSAVSPVSMQLACWLCYDPGLDAAFVARLTIDAAKVIHIPATQQNALRQQIARAACERSPFLFPSPRDATQPVKPMALTQALRRARKGLTLPGGAGFRLIRTVGIVTRLREDGAHPHQIMREAGIHDRRGFQRYVTLARRGI